MDKVAIDIKKTGAVLGPIHHVAGPNLVEKGAGLGHGTRRWDSFRRKK
jgi:hypothetical protein